MMKSWEISFSERKMINVMLLEIEPIRFCVELGKYQNSSKTF